MIELAILGLLREQELHGYELRKRLAELLGSRLAVSFGSLYPALARLEAEGSVKAVEALTEPAPSPAPSTGSLTGEASAYLLARRRSAGTGPRRGRGKKVYGITERGAEHLIELLDDPALDDRSFALKVAFCGELAPGRRIELFERRRGQLNGRLADARGAGRRPRRTDGGNRYHRSLREHDTQAIEHDIAWLDGLVADERARVANGADPDEPNRKDRQP